MKENIIKTRNNMIDKLFDWLHSNMEFRIREERRGKHVLYYPQVKGGLLGKLGVWRYFNPFGYDNNRYTICAKSDIIKMYPRSSEFKDCAEKAIDEFIKTLIPLGGGAAKREKKRVSYKYRTVGSDGIVRYI